MKKNRLYLAGAGLAALALFWSLRPGNGCRPPTDLRDAPNDMPADFGDVKSIVEAAKNGGETVPAPAPEAGGRRISVNNAGSQADVEAAAKAVFGYFEKMLGTAAAPRALKPGVGFAKSSAQQESLKFEKLLFRQELEPIRNGYLKTEAFFMTSKGVAVRLSATKAANCPDGGVECADREKFFLALTADDGRTWFVRGMKLLISSLLFGEKVVIDGEKFQVKLNADLGEPGKSLINITGKKGKKALEITAAKLGEAVAAKGVDVVLSGRQGYKLACGNELTQDKEGTRFTSRLLVMIIPLPLVNASNYQLIDTAEFSSGAVYPFLEPGYGFRIAGGGIEIGKL